jgi:preprotein translocase subunit YajC
MGGFQSFLLPLLVLLLAVPLFMGARKQKKQVAQQQQMQSQLTVGDRVMTTAGLYATVADDSDDTTIDLEIADGVITTWARQVVRERVIPADEDAEGAEDDEQPAAAEGSSADADASSATATAAQSSEGQSESGAQVAPPLEHGKK